MRMSERVGRAIHSASFDLGFDAGPRDWGALPEEMRIRYCEAALKVISAFRTPTDAMLAEGGRRGMPHDAANVWERMVFVALYEGDE